MIPMIQFAEVEDYLEKVRGEIQDVDIYGTVADIISSIRLGGDSLLRDYSDQYGDVIDGEFELSEEEIEAAVAKVSDETKAVLEEAAEHIHVFATATMKNLKKVIVQRDGYRLGMQYKPVQNVACYVPGGRYPLPSTALMTAITARAAGVKNVYITSPGIKPEVVYAARLAKATSIFRIGGAQAVAGFAFGTRTIPAVDMVVGPGNVWVTEAKRQLQGYIGIDMLAGPSEVGILAEANDIDMETVTLDLLAQAEHDPMAKAWLISTNKELLGTVQQQLEQTRNSMHLPEYVGEALGNSALIHCESEDQCIEACNKLAPEHLMLISKQYVDRFLEFEHFGSAFLGPEATVAHGDYMAGQNHTLPTAGRARFSSGLSPLSFIRSQTWMEPTGMMNDLHEQTARFAEIENLRAHAASVRARIKSS